MSKKPATTPAQLSGNGYTHVRQLPDGTYAGLCKLLFTTAICTGLDYHGWAYRYCFESADTALTELNRLENMDDLPVGFIARRFG